MDTKTLNELRDVFETQFNVLISESNPSTHLCANNEDRRRKIPKLDAPDPDYPYALRLALGVFHACRSIGVRKCGHPSCMATMDDLRSSMPLCPTWTGLELWALQVAACFCSGQSLLQSGLLLPVWGEVTSIKEKWHLELAPDDMSYGAKPAPFVDWARQVNPFEVITLLSWDFWLPWRCYRNLSRLMMECAQFNEYQDKAMVQALSRVRELHLCPHRVWAIASNLPDRESNIPHLIPYKHSLCSYKHDYCSTGLSHKNCTYNYCELSAVNFTNVVQCHRPTCHGKCQKKKFPVRLLDQAANENRPTAWAIDGELRPLEVGERYMAISHVWSDGTGGSGKVNKCMYDFFCDVARKLNCKGLWWDAICIPQDKHARAKAINHMHEYYSQAACTIVHDTCLAMSEWVDGNHAAFALVMSNWFTRGWTALELARSQHVEVLFNARGSTGYILKNIDVDIVSGRAIVPSMSRQVTTEAIESLRKNQYDPEVGYYSLNHVLTALGPRFTSWSRDRAIIAGQLVGIETLADDQRSIYQQIVCKIGMISSDQLFHNAACSTVTGPFAWLPSSLFDLPISETETLADDIQVLNDGSLCGRFGIILLPANFQFFWDKMHPMSIYDVRAALKDDRHVILFETDIRPVARGLLVKVMKDTSNPTYRGVLCHYVGPLHFASLQLDEKTGQLPRHNYYHFIRISDIGTDLDTGISAANHILSLECLSLPVVVQFTQGILKFAYPLNA